MAVRNDIRPAIARGSLVHQVGEVQFAEFRRAACAWSALEADRAEAMELQLKAKHEAQDAPSAEQCMHGCRRIVELLERASERNSRGEHADVQELIERAQRIAAEVARSLEGAA